MSPQMDANKRKLNQLFGSICLTIQRLPIGSVFIEIVFFCVISVVRGLFY